MIYKILFIDDEEVRHKLMSKKYYGHNITYVKTAKEAFKALKNDTFDVIFLDHDLGTDKTGADIAERIKKMKIKSQVIVHSLNPVGAKNIQNILPHARLMPGAFM